MAGQAIARSAFAEATAGRASALLRQTLRSLRLCASALNCLLKATPYAAACAKAAARQAVARSAFAEATAGRASALLRRTLRSLRLCASAL